MPDDVVLDRDALEARIARLTGDLETARAQAAAFALALDVLGRVDTGTGPEAVAAAVVDLFKALFAPGDVRLSVADGCGHALRSRPADALERARFEPTDDGRGFVVKLAHEGRLVGTVTVDRLAMPAYRDRYENTALSIAPVVAMLLVHARSLHGIIAICSYCKRIRDAEGMWQPLEAYLSEHSEALFSHGVCPTCMERVSGPDNPAGGAPPRRPPPGR